MSTAVLPMRVQTYDLHAGHRALIDMALDMHENVIIFLGVSPVKGDADDPLDFETRRLMIQSAYPQVTIGSISNHEDDELWSERLDRRIREYAPFGDIQLYCGRGGFIKHYSGKFHVAEMDEVASPSGTDLRKKAAMHPMDSTEFRAGVIYGLENRYPQVIPVVDAAIVRFHDKQWQTLMFRRAWGGWRFIGGFVDMDDASYLTAAIRETQEECGLELLPEYCKHSFSEPIDDWRYKGRRKSSLMTTMHVFDITGSCDIDLESLPLDEGFIEARWIPLTYGWKDEIIHAAHYNLYQGVTAWTKDRNTDIPHTHTQD